MKKFTVLLVMVLLILMVNSATHAAPSLVNTFTVSPSTVAIGNAATFQGTYAVTTPGTTQVAICFYFAAADEPLWDANFTALSSAAGVPLSKYAAANPCPPTPAYQSIAFYATDTTNAGFGDTFTQGVVVPNVSPGVKNAVARYYEGSACDNGNPPGSANCNVADNFIMENFTVNPAPPTPTPDTGLSGTIIDSKTLQPWVHGAEIVVIQTSGVNVGMKANTFVAADGTWSVNFGTTDTIELCSGCTTGNEYATYQVKVNFKCDLQSAADGSGIIGEGTRSSITVSDDDNCGVPLVGIPVNFEETVTDSASGGVIDVGDWETGRGPTAVSLQSITADNNATTTAGIGLVIMMLAGVTFVAVRRREVA